MYYFVAYCIQYAIAKAVKLSSALVMVCVSTKY